MAHEGSDVHFFVFFVEGDAEFCAWERGRDFFASFFSHAWSSFLVHFTHPTPINHPTAHQHLQQSKN